MPIVQKRKLEGQRGAQSPQDNSINRSDRARTMAANPCPVLCPLPSTAPALSQALPVLCVRWAMDQIGWKTCSLLPLSASLQSQVDPPKVGLV